MSADSNARLLAEIKSLRSQNRLCYVFMSLGFGCVFLMGAFDPRNKEVRAQRLIIVDEDQKPRALLMSEKGQTFLTLFDAKQETRMRLAVDSNNESFLQMYSPDLKRSTYFRMGEKDQEMVMTDDQARPGINIGLGEQPVLRVRDENQNDRLALKINSEETQLMVSDPNGQKRVGIFAQQANSGVVLNNANGEPQALVAELPGQGPLVLLQHEGKKRQIRVD